MRLATAFLKSDTVPHGQQPAIEPSGHALDWTKISITKTTIRSEASQDNRSAPAARSRRNTGVSHT
eukprot:717065-Lingulodinium_polyedra.AAC.1